MKLKISIKAEGKNGMNEANLFLFFGLCVCVIILLKEKIAWLAGLAGLTGD